MPEILISNDPLADLRTHRVQQIALFVAAAELLVIPMYWSEQAWGAVIPLMAGMFMMLLCLAMARKGFTDAACVTLVVTITVMSGALQWLDQGLRDASVLAFPVVLILAGLLIGVRAFVALLVTMVAYLAFMNMATEVWGWRDNRSGYDPFDHVRDASVILAVGGWSVWFVVNDLRSVLRKLNEQINKYHESQRNLSHVSQHDMLTNLPNRHVARELVNRAIAQAQRQGSHVGLIFLNLDHFKSINDTLGHQAGDELLQLVAERLRASVRSSDVLARHGGDEFVVCLNDVSGPSEASQVAATLLQSFATAFRVSQQSVMTTCSAGLALFPADGDDYDALLRNADIALTMAKSSGRNTFRFFDQDMQKAIFERVALANGLRVALEEKQLVLYYQPQLNGNREICGAEALVRWIHPIRGMVSPTEFIPVAEDNGLILPLGHWVLEEACTQIARWSTQAAFADLVIAVNISAAQLKQEDFVSNVVSVLEATGASPNRLKLELTESQLVSNVDETIRKMSALKAFGVSFSLDDFGTGYSSLSYLSRLPLDQLKIDRSFVDGIESRDDAVAICAATISLAHSLKLKVVAEGVETEAQRYFLSTVHRCDLIQGYLHSRPLEVSAFERFTLENKKGILAGRHPENHT
jgi:diguanylate cyclase (GGDEF)-like protein